MTEVAYKGSGSVVAHIVQSTEPLLDALDELVAMEEGVYR